MCCSIKPLRMPDRQASESEIAETALQYVRKVSGYRNPSCANQVVFENAVGEIVQATEKLLNQLQPKTPAS